MPDNPNEPRPFDAVLGDLSRPPVNAAVLGGLAGVKHRLASTSDEVRIAALYEAIKYDQAGLDLVVEIVKTETGAVQCAAWNLLGNKIGKTAKQLPQYLQTFTFDVITVNDRGEEISHIPSSASYFPEDLGDGIILEMVWIPGGTFLMGLQETEKERYNSESPLHQVTIQPFFMGKYPVTQAQWKAVAALPQINISLNPNPFDKWANLPVDGVSWDDAMEFCARLAKKTGKIYRLPSEAEWEYACRAGTTTPFHFGETITRDLANYYKEYTGQITEVGSFPPNTFGLYDMHGNVWEWCADLWDENYRSALPDGTVWEPGGKTRYRMLRGGSCKSVPRGCRSAYRYGAAEYAVANFSNFNLSIGFRVVCSSAWTP